MAEDLQQQVTKRFPDIWRNQGYERGIGLINVKEFKEKGKNFFIPKYQRGYRWGVQEVRDLLDDIRDFFAKTADEFYCLQPLVVQKMKDENIKKNELSGSNWFEVIDGQQRLTTVFILLKYMCKDNFYSINFETRKDSEAFLAEIDENKQEENTENIDFFHIVMAKHTIEEWFKNNNLGREKFLENILNRVKFIWYESMDKDPVEVFTRLNIGKISLTNAELIKALFLNRSNFGNETANLIKLRQQEIASEWDRIEYTLQDDAFWLFLHDTGYSNPTRIDFIFELIQEKDVLRLDEEQKKKVGTDKYRTFRYFYEYFKQGRPKAEDSTESKESGSAQFGKIMEECWKNYVKKFFQTFKEWYDDVELYHYVGFLIDQGTTVGELLDSWITQVDKESFIKYLRDRIREKISHCRDLNQQYEIAGKPKTGCKPLLLLHNVQTVINQAKKSRNTYGRTEFYRFPFNMYKIERWDVEHIDSFIDNPLTNPKDQEDYLRYSLIDSEIQKNQALRDKIIKCLEDSNHDGFDDIRMKINEADSNPKRLDENEKNQIRNFVLLDSSTNRGYGNAIFPVKRRIIICKDQGKKISVERDRKGGIVFDEKDRVSFKEEDAVTGNQKYSKNGKDNTAEIETVVQQKWKQSYSKNGNKSTAL